MTFLHASYLHLLWLALFPLALWLFRRKAKRVQVSTLLFFRTLAREHQESAWLRRLKKLLSLLLTLLVMAFAVLALARPFRAGDGETPKSLVILLDRSASMSAVDDKGETRLAAAKARIKERLNALPENVITSLIIYDAKPDVAQSRSTNRRELMRILDQVQVMPMEDKPEDALVVARRLAALDAPAEIWLVSDRTLTAETSGSEETNTHVRAIQVALEKPVNIGITGFQIRPTPLSRNHFDAFVEISAASSNTKSVEATLEARLDGRPVQLRQLDLKPGESVKLILPLEGGKGQRLEMEVRLTGDCFPWDNLVMAPLPEPKPLVVAWFSETPDPFVGLALSSLLAEERIQVLKGGANDWPMKDKPDVYVFENWLPKEWPTNAPALVLNPPSSVGPIHARKLDNGVPYDTVRSVLPEHPVLYRVASGRIAVTQTSVLNVSDTLETLWMAGNEPVLAAGEAGGQRLVVMGFAPSRSEQLALLSSFPLLIGNAIYWCAENNDALASLNPKRSGAIVPVNASLVKWHAWDGAVVRDFTEEVKGGWLELRHLGMFETEDGKSEATLLLSLRETDVPLLDVSKTPVENSKLQHWANGSNWSTALLWAVMVLLLLESWLFHRQTVY